MGLIRNQNAAALLRDAVVLDLGDIAGQADAIRIKARRDAERITQEARDVASRILRNKQEEGFHAGFEKGHREGIAQGREEGREQAVTQMADAIHSALHGWNEALNVFVGCRENLNTEAKHDVLCLAIEIAQRIVYRVIEQDPSVIEDQLAETLSLLAQRTAVVVHVHPRDLETSKQIMPTLIDRLDHCEDATVVADESVTPGGCYVRAGKGDIDARIETQLDRIIETLLPATVSGEHEQHADSGLIPRDDAQDPASENPPDQQFDGQSSNGGDVTS